ncbi:MAG: ferritin-like domain-containing protein [Nitrospirae bacterium]|nr:ferritin-like domain-containing protein [Nitrospirota bacterium]
MPELNRQGSNGFGHPSPATESLFAELETIYTWNYETEKQDLYNLYEKAKKEQWNATTQLAWETEVIPGEEYVPDINIPIYGTHLWDKLTKQEIRKLRKEQLAWTLSQFLHGEQGALLVTAQIVNSVPWVDGKLYGSTQVVDEGRHVEVFKRYLTEKVRHQYPVNVHLKTLLDTILKDTRWDMKYLGMQVLVEGLALAAFALIRDYTSEPLMKEMLAYVMQDEARHVAFGVLSLRLAYEGMSDSDRKIREEFAFEGCQLMYHRFLAEEVAESMGMPKNEWIEIQKNSDVMKEFRKLLFSRVVPILKRLDLLTDRMRPHYAELGILRWENEKTGLPVVEPAAQAQ